MAVAEAGAVTGAAVIDVDVVYCPRPGTCDTSTLRLSSGSTIADALRASGVLERHGLTVDGLRVGVWSRVMPLDAPLRERDRVEVYRPLLVDPKEARRLRYQRHREAARL